MQILLFSFSFAGPDEPPLEAETELPRYRLLSFWTSLKQKVEPQLEDVAGAAEAEVYIYRYIDI